MGTCFSCPAVQCDSVMDNTSADHANTSEDHGYAVVGRSSRKASEYSVYGYISEYDVSSFYDSDMEHFSNRQLHRKLLFEKEMRDYEAQMMRNAVSEVMKECLTNKLIVEKILQNFSDTELLHKLSFVNKLWNYEARRVMRKRGNLVARLRLLSNHDADPYKHFKDLELDLQRMNIIPFCGISIKAWYYTQPASCPTMGPDSTLGAILARMTLRKFSVDLRGHWLGHKDCPTLLLIKEVFHHFSSVLETLHLNIEEGIEEFTTTTIQHNTFPCLKIFEPGKAFSQLDGSYSSLIRALVSRAPNLQELHCCGDMNRRRQLLEGSSAVFVHCGRVKAPFHEISDSEVDVLRLVNMEMEYTGPEFNLERFNRITPILLQVCCTTTLRSMTVDAALAVPLMSFGVCFKNVVELKLSIDYARLQLNEQRILSFVKDFDFTRIFPILFKVHIRQSQPQVEVEPYHLNRIVEGAEAVLWEPLSDRACNINKLSFEVTLDHDNTQFFAEMFPSIQQLKLKNDDGEIPFRSIWKHWQKLKKIQVSGKIAVFNLDSVFCGIFPEEVAELEQMDDEYLKRVNIVPVMPAITCLRNLRDLILRFELSPLQDPTLLFSKITRLIAFKRLRGLSVFLWTSRDGVYQGLTPVD